MVRVIIEIEGSEENIEDILSVIEQSAVSKIALKMIDDPTETSILERLSSLLI